MYLFTYDKGKRLIVDVHGRADAEYIAGSEMSRTGQHIEVEPWEAFPERFIYDHITEHWYNIPSRATSRNRGRWVCFYEVPFE